ncbi:MAG: prepilin-type N-terminal cleavage/methylation domain-containing protein [Planctomycetes bacterium]|nr:prepilin-type N-terminal cleavage/methylation domain-containing protein [Planctomycetota bacterium]
MACPASGACPERSRRVQRPAGFTLVEVAFGLVILSVLVVAIYEALNQGNAAFWRQSERAQMEAMAASTLNRVAEALRQASADTFTPLAPVDVDDLTYRIPTDYVAGAMVWSGLRGVSFDNDPQDPANGLDDDGDTLIDEGRIILTDADTGEVESLPGIVEGGSLSITLADGKLTISFTMQKVIDGTTEEVDLSTTVTLRNSGGEP